MPLNFPAKPDVQLENSPLVEVICQVRFPPILRISTEEPSSLQEEIRSQFPKLEQEAGFLFRIVGPSAKQEPLSEVPTKTYRFRTIDEKTAISLSSDFFALSTNVYSHWEKFAEQLNLAYQAVQKVYKPNFSTRIGLRYIDRLTSTNTGCKTIDEIFTLLRPELTIHARSNAWGNATEMVSRLLLKDDSAKLTLSTAYGEENGEPFFVLDFDYFEEGTLPLDDLIDRCTRYNQVIYRAFRWCILDEKLSVFKPKQKVMQRK